jgi:hypothetical protein
MDDDDRIDDSATVCERCDDEFTLVRGDADDARWCDSCAQEIATESEATISTLRAALARAERERDQAIDERDSAQWARRDIERRYQQRSGVPLSEDAATKCARCGNYPSIGMCDPGNPGLLHDMRGVEGRDAARAEVEAVRAENTRLRALIPTCTRGPKACDAEIAELKEKLAAARSDLARVTAERDEAVAKASDEAFLEYADRHAKNTIALAKPGVYCRGEPGSALRAAQDAFDELLTTAHAQRAAAERRGEALRSALEAIAAHGAAIDDEPESRRVARNALAACDASRPVAPAGEGERDGKPADSEADQNAKRWDCLALLMGYNELAKDATTLGAKMYLRMGRDVAHKRYEELGGQIDITVTPPLVIVDTRPPWVALTQRDVDLMREAVADYDAGRIVALAAPAAATAGKEKR